MIVTISSPLPKDAYLRFLKDNMGSRFDFLERFTGIFIWNIFSVTHHAGYEWNRKITNEKNTALGYIQSTEDGCEVKLITLKGMLAPTQFLLMLVLSLAFYMVFSMVTLDFSFEVLHFYPFIALIVLLLAPIEALIESMTDASAASERSLLSLMMDPEHPFDNLNKV